MPRSRPTSTQGAVRSDIIQKKKQRKVTSRLRAQNHYQDARTTAQTDHAIDHATSSRGDFKVNPEVSASSGEATSSAKSGDSTASLLAQSPTIVASATEYPSKPPPGDIFCLGGAILRTQVNVGLAPHLDTPRDSHEVHSKTSNSPSTSTDEVKKGVSSFAKSTPLFARLLSGANSLRIPDANRARLSRWLRDLQLTARGRRLGIKTCRGLLRVLEIISRAVAVAGSFVARTTAQAILTNFHAIKDRLSTEVLLTTAVQQDVQEENNEPAEAPRPDPGFWWMNTIRKDDFANATFASEHPRFGFQPGNDKKHPDSKFVGIAFQPNLTPVQYDHHVAERRSQLEKIGIVRDVPCDFFICFEVIPFLVHAVFSGPWANIDGKIGLQNDAWDATILGITVPAESGRPEPPYGDQGPPTPCSPLHFFSRPGESPRMAQAFPTCQGYGASGWHDMLSWIRSREQAAGSPQCLL